MRIVITTTLLLAMFVTAVHSRSTVSTDLEFRKQLSAALPDYLAISDALAASDHPAAQKAAGKLVETLSGIRDEKLSESERELWGKIGPRMKNDAEHINKTGDIERQREHFAPLSNDMFTALTAFKANGIEVYQHYCPMKKATWLSASKEVRNPYYGARMLTCGSLRSSLKKNSDL